MENLFISNNTAIEFLFGMYRLQNNQAMIDKVSGDNSRFKPNEKITAWAEENIKHIPSSIKEKLEVYFNRESFLGLCLNPLIIENDIQTVGEFLHFIQQLDPKHMLLEFIDTGFGPENGIVSLELVEEMLKDEKKAIDFINKNMSIPPKQKWEILQLFLEPGRVERDLGELFLWFEREIFSKNLPEILEVTSKKVEEIKGRIEKYGKDYISILTNTDYRKMQIDNKMLINISYYHEFEIFRSSLRNSMGQICIIGYRYPELKVEPKHAVLGNVQMFKALGDETRLNMVRLLSKKPWYGRELARELGLSNSTVSYHLSFLESNGFVKAESVDNRVYFSLDTDNFKKVINDRIDNMLK